MTANAVWTLPFDETGDLVRSARQRMAAARMTTILLAALVVFSLLFAPMLRGWEYADLFGYVGLAAAMVWLFLGMGAARQGRRVREAAALANVGRGDLAEGRARDVFESFCLLRPVTVGAAAVLARVRHGQGRYTEAVTLAAFVIERPERLLGGDKRAIRLLLAESLLAAGDTAGAQAAVMPLYVPAQRDADRLVLGDAMRLLAIQLTSQARTEQWDAIRGTLSNTVAMVELMPPRECARMTRILADAAQNGGAMFAEWARLLDRRADVLGVGKSS